MVWRGEITMSNIETKAKTSSDIWSDMDTINDAFRRGSLTGDEQWIPLVDAQKEITTLETEVNAVRQCLEFVKNLSAQRFKQIEAANNTLKQARDFIEAIGDDKLSANHVLNLISTLEETLHIPRKEPQP